jgi:hypothetical protein
VSASGQTMSYAPNHLETAQSLTGATTASAEAEKGPDRALTQLAETIVNQEAA